MALKPTLLITGGSGYLGRYLAAGAADHYQVHATYSSNRAAIRIGEAHSLALTNRQAVYDLITALSPQAIIHAAAANPGSDEATMMQINAEGSRFVAEGALACGARLVHVSTDTVHDGQNAPYDDEAPPTPINSYGRSKAAAEAAVLAVDHGAAIVRTSLIYGLTVMDRGTEGFVKRLATGEELVLFQDVIRQPVWTGTLVTALLKLAFEKTDFAGRLNVMGAQALTREEFGRRMLDWWGIEGLERVRSGLAAGLPNIAMPLDLRAPIERGQALLQMPFPGVDAVLAGARPT